MLSHCQPSSLLLDSSNVLRSTCDDAHCKVSAASTSGYVKLWLPPRQSRGVSLGRLEAERTQPRPHHAKDFGPWTKRAVPRPSRLWRDRGRYGGLRHLTPLSGALPVRVGVSIGDSLACIARPDRGASRALSREDARRAWAGCRRRAHTCGHDGYGTSGAI